MLHKEFPQETPLRIERSKGKGYYESHFGSVLLVSIAGTLFFVG